MRNAWLVAGAILLAAMVLVLFLPLPSTSSAEIDQLNGLVIGPPSFPRSQATPLSVSWTNASPFTFVELVPCPSYGCSSLAASPPTSPTPRGAWSVVASGASGGLSLSAPTNVSYLLLTNSSAPILVQVTWSEFPELSFGWEILGLLGIPFLVAGILLPEAGILRGAARRKARPAPSAPIPDHLFREGLTCPQCGLAQIPREERQCPRCDAPLPPSGPRPGRALFAHVARPGAFWDLVEDLRFAPDRILILTGEDPAWLETQYHLRGARILRWGTGTDGEDRISAADLGAVRTRIESHWQQVPDGLVVITDLPGPSSREDGEVVEGFLRDLSSIARNRGGTLFVGVTSGALTGPQVTRWGTFLDRVA